MVFFFWLLNQSMREIPMQLPSTAVINNMPSPADHSIMLKMTPAHLNKDIRSHRARSLPKKSKRNPVQIFSLRCIAEQRSSNRPFANKRGRPVHIHFDCSV
jgi:hypothetical protein